MMKNIPIWKRGLLSACLLFVTISPRHALAWDYEGYISNVTVYKGKVYIAVGEGVGGAGSNPCAGAIFIFDPSTSIGRALLSTSLTAKATGRRVYVWGDNNCSWAPYGGGATGQGMVGLDLKG